MILAIALACSTFLSTLLGGIVALKNRDRLHRILGLTAGVILGVIAFELLPEIFEIVHQQGIDSTWPMIALVLGFLVFHIAEKTIAMHHAHDEEYQDHKHPKIGLASASALVGHSFLDAVGIGLGFQSDILPEAHSKHPSKLTMLLTVLGVVFMFVVTRFV